MIRSSRASRGRLWRRAVATVGALALLSGGVVAGAAPAHAGNAPWTESATVWPSSSVPAGDFVQFRVGWGDVDSGEQVRPVICKTNGISGGICVGGEWVHGSLQPWNPATVYDNTSGTPVGTYNYYAFVCDSTGLCSESIAGTFTVVSGVPSATSVSASPDSVPAGDAVTFSVGWSDPNSGERMKALVCKTNAVTASSCPDGAWAVGSRSPSQPATVAYRTTTADMGSNGYYAFVCDLRDLCSNGVAGAFTVTSARCSDGVDNDGDTHVDFPADPGCGSPDDSSEAATCPPTAELVVACLDPGSLLEEYVASDAGTSGGTEHEIAGYVDQYRFHVGIVTTTLTCVRLVVDGTDVNPCATAGGTFVTRITSLVQRPAEPVIETNPLATVRVCQAELTLTAAGNGINSAPAYALC